MGRVECCVRRGEKGLAWFRGEVTHDHLDGTYDIKYDDGEVSAKVARKLMWVLRAPSVGIKLDGMPLYLSQRVEGRQGRKKPWVEGTIVAADAAAQLYEVQYSDGTRESGVERWLLRPHTGTYGSVCLYVYRTD